MEELFSKLMDLGYTQTYIGNESVAAHIAVYYEKHGSLDGCTMVLESDRKPLEKWFKPVKISQDPFDWGLVPFACSGVSPGVLDYFDFATLTQPRRSGGCSG